MQNGINDYRVHRFNVGDRIFFEEEVLTISQLTYINGWAAYFVTEVSYKVADIDCSVPPVPVEETSNF
jgi:hypothetical protein